MNKPLAFALGMVAIELLTGCGFYLNTVEDTTFYSVPTTATPWRSLSSGVDVHWWFECYNGRDKHAEPRCTTMNMVAMRSGAAPDWPAVARPRQPHASFFELKSIVPVLSAHQGTTRRVLGMSTDEIARAEFFILAAGADGIDYIDNLHSYERVRQMDVWHNAICTRQTMPVPRLVVEDERSLWVFADTDANPSCGKGRADWRAPIDMMTFDHPERYPDLLGKPMQLFYLDRAEADKADFGQPRMATSDIRLLERSPRSVVRLASVPTPAGKVFALEDGRVVTPLPTAPVANVYCRYTTTHFGWTMFGNSPDRKLVGCKPYAAADKSAGR